MKLSSVTILAVLSSASAFSPQIQQRSRATSLQGYLDDINSWVNEPDPNPIPEEEDREALKMNKEDVDRFSVGNWNDYVEFDEFDGGDGQMGVAGDGNKKLEQFDMTEVNAVANSRSMSAKNAWGRETGYAEELRNKGMDTQRAQQLENWHSQQEVALKRKSQQNMISQYESNYSEDENWRNLAKFGVERNQEFDLNDEFGAVDAGEVVGVIELTARMYGPAAVYEFGLRNPYMGFADFRAAFSGDTSEEWTVEPSEGSLKQKEDTPFLVRFKAQKPGVSEGYLVIETEDFKNTYKVIGTTA